MSRLSLLGAGPSSGGEIDGPNTISGLRAWWKTDSGITMDGSNRVSSWVDQSGNDYTFAQATSGKRPQLIDDAVNGLPTLRFTRAREDHMKLSSMLGLTNGSARTFGLVVRCHTVDDAQMPFFSQGQEGSGTGLYGIDANTFFGAGNVFGMRTENTFDSNASTTTSYTYIVVKHALTTSGQALIANTTYRLNGATKTLTVKYQTDHFSDMSTANVTTIGAYAHLSSWFGNLDICEIAVYNRDIDAEDLGVLETYFASRYDI